MSAKMLCRTCGNVGTPRQTLKGHWLISFILLCLYVVPGLIYMIWRRTGIKPACTVCGSEQLVPPGSLGGQEHLATRLTQGTHVKCPDCRELVLWDARRCKHCGCALVPGEKP